MIQRTPPVPFPMKPTPAHPSINQSTNQPPMSLYFKHFSLLPPPSTKLYSTTIPFHIEISLFAY